MNFKNIIKYSLLVLLILFGIFSYFFYKDMIKKILIEPFGFEMGVRDVNYVLSNAFHKRYTDSYSLSTPIKRSIYDKLDPEGYCKVNFGKKLIENSSIYSLKIVPKPISLPPPFKDKIVYNISIHPIFGIYRISALINPKKPKNFIGGKNHWKYYVKNEIGKEIIPLLKAKYGITYNLIFKRSRYEFSSYRNDLKDKNIDIVFDDSYSLNGVNIIYQWWYLGFLDNKKTPQRESFDKCNDEIELIADQEEKNINQKKIKKYIEKRIEDKKRKKQNKNNL